MVEKSMSTEKLEDGRLLGSFIPAKPPSRLFY
jgi:hypothetical protein